MSLFNSKKLSESQLQKIVKSEENRISALRMQMFECHPFWGHLLMQMHIVPSVNLDGIACTDCSEHIWYNPLLTRYVTTQELGFIICHEICHTVLASSERRSGRNAERWNCATDYAINLLVAEIRKPGHWHGERMYQVPETDIPGYGKITPLLDKSFRGLVAESIYERLIDRNLPESVTVTVELARPGNGASDASGGGSGDIQMNGTTFESGAIDIHLPVMLDERKCEEIAERIRDAVGTWIHNGKKGDVPMSSIRHLLPEVASKVPWQRLLQIYGGQVLARDDYSLAHPNKRYLIDDFIVPGTHAEKLEHVVVALDTSASMDDEMLRKAFAEIRKISEQTDRLTLIVADANVQQVIESPDLERFLGCMKVRGGGGTSHEPVFAYIREKRLMPDLFIGLTDLATIFPAGAPPFPVLWLCTVKGAGAPFGKVIHVDDNGAMHTNTGTKADGAATVKAAAAAAAASITADDDDDEDDDECPF